MAKERQAKQAWTTAVRTTAAEIMRRCESADRLARSSGAPSAFEPAAAVNSVEDLNRLLSEQNAPTEKTDDGSSSAAENRAENKTPLELPKSAKIEIAYRLDFSARVRAHAGISVDPLVIDYTRLRFSDQPASAVSFFSRQLKGALEHAIQNGRWLDLVSKTKSGRIRSIDVILTRAQPLDDVAAAPNRSRSEDLIAEILAIETSDFINDAQTTTVAERR
jgi:hypothetical protein